MMRITKKRIFYALCWLFIVPMGLMAQVSGPSGIVRDDAGNPLTGVSILAKGSGQAAQTDGEGRFSLPVLAKGTILVFSYVGMAAKELVYDGLAELNVTLEPEANDLEEVVVVGYGTVQKKDLTGAVATVSGRDIADRKQVRVSQALQGAVPGVMVTRSSGAANAAASIRIRGVTTIGNSNPLVIVDGVPATLDWVNPNDIESISVLKDAASASIYGSRAAAGVILVTTKRAKKGQVSLDYNAEFGFETPTATAQYADAKTYMRVLNERNWNDNNNNANEYPIFPKDLIDGYDASHLENPNLYPATDWLTTMMRNRAPRQSHAINLTAGMASVQSKVSLVYDQTEGFYARRGYDRLTVRANNDFKINEDISVEVDVSNIYSVATQPSYVINPASGSAPIYAALWDDGRIAAGKSGVNPYARMRDGGDYRFMANVVRGKAAVHYSPLKGLKLSGIVSPELYMDKGKTFVTKLPYTLADDPNATGGFIEGLNQTRLSESRGDNYNITTQLLANYNAAIGDHRMDFMVGNENYNYFSESLGASREQYQLSTFPYLNLGNANYQYNSGSAFENAYRSFFGRVMYNYAGRYFLQANARYDGSSRFHKDYRWGFFPSVSGAWVISEEAFAKDNPVFSFLKLRASWGTLGNERIGNYPYQSTIGFDNALFFQGANVVSTQTAAIMQYAIRDISWETTGSYDLGLDASFLGSRLNFTADYYKKTTRDMLLSLEIPDYIGLSNPEQNTGKMFTKGWEAELAWRDQLGDFTYAVSANISDSRSVMGHLGGTQFLGSKVKFEGSEFDEWYGYRAMGIYQTQEAVDQSARLNAQVKPGDIQYADISGPNGVPDGVISAEYDRVLLGGSLPRYLYGGTIRVGYKQLDLSCAFQGIGKQLSQATTAMVQPFREEYIEVPQAIVGKYWSRYQTAEQNQQAAYPRVSTTGNANNYAFSDFWLFNGSYMRIKNVMMSYQLPVDWTSKAKMSSVRLFLSVSDLPAFNNHPQGWDPEVGEYWIATSYLAGLSVRF